MTKLVTMLNLLHGSREAIFAVAEDAPPLLRERLKVLAEMTGMVYQMASEVSIGLPRDAPHQQVQPPGPGVSSPGSG